MSNPYYCRGRNIIKCDIDIFIFLSTTIFMQNSCAFLTTLYKYIIFTAYLKEKKKQQRELKQDIALKDFPFHHVPLFISKITCNLLDIRCIVKRLYRKNKPIIDS